MFMKESSQKFREGKYRSSTNEIAITGIGIVSPIGNGLQAFKENLFKGTSGIAPVTRFNAGPYKCKVAAEVNAESLACPPYSKAIELKRMDRFVKYALCASWQALGMAFSHNFDLTLRETGLLAIGTGMGGLPNMENGVERQRNLGPHLTSPYLIPSLIPNMAGSFIARALDWDGRQITIAAACASGSMAIGEAMENIRAGKVKWALAGGTEAVITPITWSGFEALHSLTTDNISRPFDVDRNGMVPGEAAVMMVLEPLQAAMERGAAILGVLQGYSMCGSAKAFVNPDAECMKKVISKALCEAGVNTPKAVMAQACGLTTGDKEEMSALVSIQDASQMKVCSIKGQVGHTFAASGPLNVAAAIASFAEEKLPAIAGMEQPDLSCGALDYCMRNQDWEAGPVLIPSYGFGGIHSALVVSNSQ